MPDAYTWHAAGSWSLDLLRPGRKHANRSFLKQSTYTSLMVQPCSGYDRSPDLHFSEHLRCNGERSLSADDPMSSGRTPRTAGQLISSAATPEPPDLILHQSLSGHMHRPVCPTYGDEHE